MLDELKHQSLTRSSGRAWVKRLLGERLTSRVKTGLIPLELAAVHAAMKQYGLGHNQLTMTDEEASVHFANGAEFNELGRLIARFFHEYKLRFLRTHLSAEEITQSSFIEVGDSDGLVLRALGKRGVSINNDPRCIRLIGRNGIEARLGFGERLDVPDKSYDVSMTFETLEHSLNPVAFLAELVRVARKKVVLSIPGVTRTIIHPRIYGQRVGEEHVFEFCTRDFVRLSSHLPLRLAHFQKMSVFASPLQPLAWLRYRLDRHPELFAGSLRWFDFYIFEIDPADHGVTFADNNAIYRECR